MEELKNFIKDNEFAILYFGTSTCAVCHGLKPQVERFLESYPNVKVKYVWVENVSELKGEFQLFTFPVLIMYYQEKEMFRMARFVPIVELKEKLDRIMEFAS